MPPLGKKKTDNPDEDFAIAKPVKKGKEAKA